MPELNRQHDDLVNENAAYFIGIPNKRLNVKGDGEGEEEEPKEEENEEEEDGEEQKQ